MSTAFSVRFKEDRTTLKAATFVSLRAAVLACIGANPGMHEAQLLERFWAHPACILKGVLQAMVKEGTLRPCVLPPRRAARLFDSDVESPADEVGVERIDAERVCYFCE